MPHPRTAEEDLKALEKRNLSQSTGIICANCGVIITVSNRHKLSWEVISLENGLCQIFWSCPHCDIGYDIGTCILT